MSNHKNTEAKEEQINELFDFAFNNPENKKKMLDLGVVKEDLAEKIRELTGLDLENYVISIDNFGIRHTMEKHGEPKTEEPRGQTAIKKGDFLKIIEIVEQADRISREGTNSAGKEVILFEKSLDETHSVAKEVRTISSVKKGKKSRLVFQSMWKRK